MLIKTIKLWNQGDIYENENKPADRFDWTLAFILLLFCLISLFAIASAQTTGQYKLLRRTHKLRTLANSMVFRRMCHYRHHDVFRAGTI